MIAAGTVVAAILISNVLCLVLLGIVAVVVPAGTSRTLRTVSRSTLLLSLPLAVSAVVINVLFSDSDQSIVVQLGPLSVAEAGVALALEVLTRILVMAGAVVLFYSTTRPSALATSLQGHGLSPRLAFVIHNAVATIPRMAHRAGEVAAAQRARGMDTEGNLWRRAQGVTAVAVPTVLGAIGEVETRTLALESRGFSRPGRRTALWPPRDSGLQRLLRWGIAVGLLLLAVARLVGAEWPC